MKPDYIEPLWEAAQQMYGAGLNYQQAVERFKSQFLLAALDHNRRHQLRTARVIGIHRNTLSREVVKCGMSRIKRKA